MTKRDTSTLRNLNTWACSTVQGASATCETCNSDGTCLTCDATAELDDIHGICRCLEEPDVLVPQTFMPLVCGKPSCDASCNTCDSGTGCATCDANASPSGDVCVCNSGYVALHGNPLKCRDENDQETCQLLDSEDPTNARKVVDATLLERLRAYAETAFSAASLSFTETANSDPRAFELALTFPSPGTNDADYGAYRYYLEYEGGLVEQDGTIVSSFNEVVDTSQNTTLTWQFTIDDLKAFDCLSSVDESAGTTFFYCPFKFNLRNRCLGEKFRYWKLTSSVETLTTTSNTNQILSIKSNFKKKFVPLCFSDGTCQIDETIGTTVTLCTDNTCDTERTDTQFTISDEMHFKIEDDSNTFGPRLDEMEFVLVDEVNSVDLNAVPILETVSMNSEGADMACYSWTISVVSQWVPEDMNEASITFNLVTRLVEDVTAPRRRMLSDNYKIASPMELKLDFDAPKSSNKNAPIQSKPATKNTEKLLPIEEEKDNDVIVAILGILCFIAIVVGIIGWICYCRAGKSKGYTQPRKVSGIGMESSVSVSAQAENNQN